MHIRKKILLAFSCCLLTACADQGMQDLREFVVNAYKDKKPQVDPLPEVRTYEPFIYSATELSDPFSVANLRPDDTATGGSTAEGPRPDLTRNREPLEDYPLDSLQMVGTLSKAGEIWVIIQAPDGTVHRVKSGNHMGQNYGMITTITEDKVELTELVRTSLGNWKERQSSIAIKAEN